jgi:putative pyruvate formate lyase activating enzyme
MRQIYLCDNQIIYHDPGPEAMALFQRLDPHYRMASIPPGAGFRPRFQYLRERRHTVSQPLFDLELDELRSILAGSAQSPPHGGRDQHAREEQYTTLEILYAAALKAMSSCSLCGWDCQTNRFSGDLGKCGLGSTFYCSDPFIHIAEEPPINPALVTNFGGCALNCLYCIDHDCVRTFSGLHPLDVESFWDKVQALMKGKTPINTLECINPTESLAGVILLLSRAPDGITLPVVLNCHLYGSALFYELAAPIADGWLADLRYGNDACARSLSGVDHYMSQARIGLDALYAQDARIIIRHLVLPGHVECCSEPALRLLADYKDKVLVSIAEEYVPAHQAHRDPKLKRRPTSEEIAQVHALVDRYGLRTIEAGGGGFWDMNTTTVW